MINLEFGLLNPDPPQYIVIGHSESPTTTNNVDLLIVSLETEQIVSPNEIPNDRFNS